MIRMYDDSQYNARIYHQRCRDCGWGITIHTWLRWYDWIVNALPTYEHTVRGALSCINYHREFEVSIPLSLQNVEENQFGYREMSDLG
ncbi:hypothetical protein KCU95_g37, partial [Aureobasidium melanogenum]